MTYTGKNEIKAYAKFLIDCGPFGDKKMNWKARLFLTDV